VLERHCRRMEITQKSQNLPNDEDDCKEEEIIKDEESETPNIEQPNIQNDDDKNNDASSQSLEARMNAICIH